MNYPYQLKSNPSQLRSFTLLERTSVLALAIAYSLFLPSIGSAMEVNTEDFNFETTPPEMFTESQAERLLCYADQTDVPQSAYLVRISSAGLLSRRFFSTSGSFDVCRDVGDGFRFDGCGFCAQVDSFNELIENSNSPAPDESTEPASSTPEGDDIELDENTSATPVSGNIPPATTSFCDYSSADQNGGWGWDPVAGASCPPIEGNIGAGDDSEAGQPNTAVDNCSYRDAAQHNGWGWDPVAGASCPPR